MVPAASGREHATGESIARRGELGWGVESPFSGYRGFRARTREWGNHRTEVTEVTEGGIGGLGVESPFGEHHGFRARTRNRGKHRTEVTEVTEGDRGLGVESPFGEHHGFRARTREGQSSHKDTELTDEGELGWGVESEQRTTAVELREGKARLCAYAGDREIYRDHRGGPGRCRSDPLAVPESLRLGGQTPRRHFGAKGKFLFLLSNRDLHSREHRPHAFKLVVQAIAGRGNVSACRRIWLLFNRARYRSRSLIVVGERDGRQGR
jgi:hypothetical protein